MSYVADPRHGDRHPAEGQPFVQMCQVVYGHRGETASTSSILEITCKSRYHSTICNWYEGGAQLCSKKEALVEKYYHHLRKQGAENLVFIAECLEEMATDFGDDAKGYLVSVEHFYKDDTTGFEECKNLLASA